MILFFGARYISNVLLQIPEAELTLVALSPSIFFVAIASVIRGYFNGKQDMTITANSQTLEQIFKTVLTVIIVEIVAIATTTNVTIMAAGANFATTLSVFLSFMYLYAYKKHSGKEERKLERRYQYKTRDNRTTMQVVKNILKIAIPISLSSIISSINKNIDSVTVMRGLKTFLSDEEAMSQFGIFSGKVDTLIGLPLSFNIAFATTLVPCISAFMAQKEVKKAKERISFSIIATMLIALPCTIGMIIFAKPILELLFPNASSGAGLLQLMSITILFMLLAQTINGALQGIGKYKVPMIALGSGVIVKFFLNLILIPIPAIGINGAAIGSITCHVISFAIGYTVLRKNLKVKLPMKNFIVKPVIATAIMSIVSYLSYIILLQIIAPRISTVIALIIAVLVYVIAVFALKILSKDEILSLPKGKNIYHFLTKMKIYKESKI